MLSNLPKRDYNKALRLIPNVLGISMNTFFNYRNIKMSEAKDIPYQKVILLEQLFGLDRGGLENFKLKIKTIHDLLVEYPGSEE